MGVLHIFSERGDDARRFDDAMKMAKSGLMEACSIWEDMKAQFSQRSGFDGRGSYGERWTHSQDGMQYRHSMSERDWQELQERRRRDAMTGQYM